MGHQLGMLVKHCPGDLFDSLKRPT